MYQKRSLILIAAALVGVIGLPALGPPLAQVHGRWDLVLAIGAVLAVMLALTQPEARLASWNGTLTQAFTGLLLRPRRWTLIIALCAGLLRLAYVVYAGPGLVEYDAATYDSLARGILGGNGYVYGGARALYAPGYPFFLTAVYAILGRNLWGVALLQAILGTAACVMLYRVTRTGDETMARSASLLLALSPGHILYTNTLRFEVLSTFLELLVLWIFLNGSLRRRRACDLLAGVALGASVLVRPPTVLLLAVLVLLVRWGHSADRWAVCLRRPAWVMAGMVLVVSPWTIRNAIVLGAFVPVSVDFDHNFCLGNDWAHNGDPPDFPWLYAEMDELSAAREYRRLAIEKMLESPKASAWLLVRKVMAMLDPFGVDRPGKCEHVMILYNLVLLVLTIRAICCRPCLAPPIARASLVYCMLWLLAIAAIHVKPRYRLPALPFASTVAASAILLKEDREGQ